MISLLQKSDIASLEKLLILVNGDEYQPLIQNYIECMFSNDFRKPVFIIYKNDIQVIGAAAFSEELFTVNTWGISWVSVHPEYRNQGIGQQLMKACISRISEKIETKSTVILATYPGKTGLYKKLGFENAAQDHEGGIFMTLNVYPDKGLKS